MPQTVPHAPFLRGIFHVHTNASHDSFVSPDALIARCLDQGIDLLAVTDHHSLAGAQVVKARAPFTVIIGEEIRTAEGGEIIGLFLSAVIPRGLPSADVIAAIRRQGGLVYAPHPFDSVRGTRWRDPAVRDAVLKAADIIEVFNGRNLHPEENRLAAEAADRRQKAPCVGADAHTLAEIGGTIALLAPAESPAQLLLSLVRATFMTAPAPWYIRARARLRSFLPR